MRPLPTLILSLVSLVAMLVPTFTEAAGTDRCKVAEIERLGGKPLQVVGRVTVDSTGYLWLGSWGGLHRFDGSEMVRIPPRMRDNSTVISERFYDMRLDAKGNLWCRIDDRLVHFDTSDYIYTDISDRLKKNLGRNIIVKQLDLNITGDTIHVSLSSGENITIPVAAPVDEAKVTATRPDFVPLRKGLALPASIISESGVTDMAFAGMLGDLYCVIARDGLIMGRHPSEPEFREIGHINLPGGRLIYHDTDVNGNLWLGADGRLYVVSPIQRLYNTIPTGGDGGVKATMSDSDGRLWLAESNGDAIAVISPDGQTIRYITPNGDFSPTYTGFGRRVYSLAEYPAGKFWIGTKPDGLYRLDPVNRQLDHVEGTESIYDIVADRYGRLWTASINEGLSCIENPTDVNISAPFDLSTLKQYPREAMRTRRIALTDDSIYVATTAGILAAPLPLPSQLATFAPEMITPRPNDPTSPAGPAISDIATAGDRLLVATESAGFDIASLDDLKFSHLNTANGGPADVIRSIAITPDQRRAVVVADDIIFTVNPSDPENGITKYSFADYGIRFTEARPVRINDSIWAVGSRNGVVAVNLTNRATETHRRPVFTSVTIQNRPDSLLSAVSDTIFLTPAERSLTLRFAALEFNHPAGVEYYISIDGGEWNTTGSTRSVTLLNLSPGTHTVAVRAIHSDGQPMTGISTMTIIVEPRFSETVTARVLLLIAILGVIGAIFWTTLYIRRIKRRQRDTLEAYLRLLEPREEAAIPSVDETAPRPAATEQFPKMNADDKALMNRIVRYVEQNITDQEMSVDALASAVATSRSTLVRKMKALLGVTPADFIRQSRLQRAAAMLRTTDLPIKHIATDCGFSDLNYFSKCFKSAFGSTPTSYRKTS